MSPLAVQIEKIVLERLETDRLAVPALPSAAVKALELLKNPGCAMRDICNAIEFDPMLAVQVIKSANGAAYGSSQLTGLEQAIGRVGLRRLKSLLVEASAQRLFESKDPRIASACRTIWDHSVAVAMVARDIAATSGAEDSESAHLAGLLHDVGKPVVAAMLLEAEKQLTKTRGVAWVDVNTWLAAIQGCHRRVGVALAKKWRLPTEVQAIIQECSEFNPANRASTANYVCFANALVKLAGIYPGEADLEDARTVEMLGRAILQIDEEVVTRIVARLKDGIPKDGPGNMA